MEKRARNYLLLIGLSIFIILAVWILSPVIIGQPINDKVYTIKEENSDKNSFTKKISQLDIDTATHDDLVKIFGEPEEYMWGDNTYTKEELPDYYLMKYSDKFQVLMVAGKIVEFRFYNPAYSFIDSISVGSSFDDVKKVLGQPISEEKAVPNSEIKEGILYKDIDGYNGFLNYKPKGKNILFSFSNYIVSEMYLRRTDRDSFLNNYKSKDALGNLPTHIIDKTDYPFINDPEIVGKWKGIDFVKEISDFNPDITKLEENENALQIAFMEGGKTNPQCWIWTKGLLIHKGEKTASKYETKEIGGIKYIFLQWKTGDYTLRGMKPSYYVFKKVE